MNNEISKSAPVKIENNENTLVGKKAAYVRPKLTRYGSISELVQLMSNVGMDGGVFPPDCTRT